MRLRRPRFTVRSLMVAVAIVDLAFPIFRMAEFYRKYYPASLIHGENENYYALQLKNLSLTEFAPSVSPDRRRSMMEGWVLQARNRVQYHDELKRKYERAATHPWDSLEPDPPEPE